MAKERKLCIIPKCPQMGANKGKGGKHHRGHFRPYCHFHLKPENRNKFHPTYKPPTE